MVQTLDFEKPVAALDAQIADLSADPARAGELERTEAKRGRLLADIDKSLTPWQKTLVARHPDRPRFLGLVDQLFEDWQPLAGDRKFADDVAILGGPARFRGRSVMLIGHEKGHDTQSRVQRNFGMAKPEGYRKAARLMEMADRFGLPIVTLVDTPGAYPGIDAEERGQAEAIARATESCLKAEVPMVSVIIGEGGSGGAVALAAANKVLMFEHSVYAVISPEGCASILWRDAAKAAEAAVAMRISAQDLAQLGVIDAIVPEPVGGAHRAPADAIARLGDSIDTALDGLEALSPAELKAEVPMVSVIIGEGGSGGAVALAAANKVLMFEHSVYAVISPEGCASILWRDAAKAAEAAVAMRISAQDLAQLGVIDAIVQEPVGGAHRAPVDAIARLGDSINAALDGLEALSPAELKADRRAKFLAFARAA